ncbi:uncharacterized protein PFL1_03478 [Pseudozyma flocculosa PF-1]|uniref:Related to aflatoxin aldehyde reductase n=2 Tax=Pseudozyma flocculosa TaxID=84751 RepID=A0A5C3FAM7_9BASI|nr:uncharacterized protein PFL1_03478 [Pseudozyma flocculosa PF-1]EPQ29191.1 hypothetical protein PFL1_03478 [Pseudozyma flocculosa PF-1]SPO41508.1 related to aflatoxin aldehyde reductase [Pseudozyma flocculosa]
MAPAPTSNVKIAFGCMTFGRAGVEQARVHDIDECRAILDIFASHGHTELDTARMYGSGSSEEYLGQMGLADASKSAFRIATKNFPSARLPVIKMDAYDHSAKDIARCIEDSLRALQTDSVDLYYLHAPDRQTPFAETLKALDDQYRLGRFQRWGLSNYTAAEVEQILDLCDKNGWIKPTVYQGVYNAITRSAEPELFPVLRRHRMAFYAFNPLGGGLFTGALARDAAVEAGSRFDPDRVQGQMYRKRYWNDTYFDALDQIRAVADKHGLTMAEIALRWMTHHSQLHRDHGDAILIGASSTRHIEQNLKDLEKGPLDPDVVAAVDRAWESVKPHAPPYHH